MGNSSIVHFSIRLRIMNHLAGVSWPRVGLGKGGCLISVVVVIVSGYNWSCSGRAGHRGIVGWSQAFIMMFLLRSCDATADHTQLGITCPALSLAFPKRGFFATARGVIVGRAGSESLLLFVVPVEEDFHCGGKEKQYAAGMLIRWSD